MIPTLFWIVSAPMYAGVHYHMANRINMTIMYATTDDDNDVDDDILILKFCRAESDVPVPYGRTVLLEKPIVLEDSLNFQSRFEALVPNAKKKRRDVLVAIMMSNCYTDNGRQEYVRELQKYMRVDFYGSCSSSELKDA